MKHKTIDYTHQEYIERLREADAVTIRALAKKIKPDIRRLVAASRLSIEDTEELMNDAIVITIRSIRSGKFQNMNYHPAAYAVGVVKKLMANRLRKQKPQTENLDNVYQESDFNPEHYLKDKERQRIVAKLLSQLGENCQQIIKLKYFKFLKDKEIIEQKLSVYTNIPSLKSKRSQCLKKLAVLAQRAGIRDVF